MRVRYFEYDGMAWHGSQQPALTGFIVVYQSHPHFKPMAQTVQRIEKSGGVGGMHLSFSKQSKKKLKLIRDVSFLPEPVKIFW